MARTAIIAAQGAALSSLQLGAGGPQADSYQVEWEGPFNPGEAMFPGSTTWVDVLDETALTIALALLEDLAESDPNWWVITG